MLSITQVGKKIREKPSLEEIFLSKKFPLDIQNLSPEERHSLIELKKRKSIIKVETLKKTFASLTKKGLDITKISLDTDVIDRLTPEMLKTGSWKKKQFRRYDVEINVPESHGGKRHFVDSATEYARRIWLDMGFKEMSGTFVQTSFWNFDALFTAQDHPVRELQDTFYLDNVNGKLPKRFVKEVKDSHEKGTKGSKGWNYSWKKEDAEKVVLRTHTTCLSAQTLSKLKDEDIPGKFFALGKCFRNETMDWSHLFEFNQTEGIVIDPNANFKHLLGYLKQFFKKMGYEDARFRPAFFPYTEPSVEIDVLHPEKKEWVELGGAGIFRPEVVVPLIGKDIPVLAWGPGFDRIIMEYYSLKDLRDMYSNNIDKLRKSRLWTKCQA
jgi:phenylalanyl-tRNA synthetase alpha chain